MFHQIANELNMFIVYLNVLLANSNVVLTEGYNRWYTAVCIQSRHLVIRPSFVYFCLKFFQILAPSGPPRDVESTDITNQTVSFSWKQPACGQRNGIITQYHNRLIDSEEEVLEENTTSSTGLEFIGLVPFTSYTLSVSAENQFGSGPVASYTTQTKEGSK